MKRNLIGYYKVAKETGSKFIPPKRSHNAIQHNIERLSLNNIRRKALRHLMKVIQLSIPYRLGFEHWLLWFVLGNTD